MNQLSLKSIIEIAAALTLAIGGIAAVVQPPQQKPAKEEQPEAQRAKPEVAIKMTPQERAVDRQERLDSRQWVDGTSQTLRRIGLVPTDGNYIEPMMYLNIRYEFSGGPRDGKWYLRRIALWNSSTESDCEKFVEDEIWASPWNKLKGVYIFDRLECVSPDKIIAHFDFVPPATE